MEDIELPPEFPQSAVDQFDRLREQGLLFYYPVEGEVTDFKGFKFEFKISPSIAKKPVLKANAPERKGKGGPFLNPDPDFVVARPGPEHVVELSMHAMMRPHYVLHTRLFAPQTDDLDLGDMAATWAVMRAIRDRAGQPPMMIYNCGYDGGASQGHKHVQVFTQPEPGFALFPEEVVVAAAKCKSPQPPDAPAILHHPTVPYQHYILPIAESEITPGHLLQVYQRLLREVRRAHAAYAETHPDDVDGSSGEDEDDAGPPASTEAYNVILAPSWMCLIPRRRGGKDGTGAGSLGMLGLLWLKSQKEREHWTALGMTEHLTWMGLPRE